MTNKLWKSEIKESIGPYSAAAIIRTIVAGSLMGTANLVPGLSGGTMLLACGVYPQLVKSVADLTTSRIEKHQLLVLVTVGVSALSAVAILAPLLGSMLDRQPVAMYSLFLGLTLGGLPLLWHAAKPANRTTVLCATIAFATMAFLEVIDPSRILPMASGASPQYVLLFSAGILGGAAMILPGLSGAYVLLILGQYRIVVDAISVASQVFQDRQWTALTESVATLFPFGVGVVLGIFGISNLVKILMEKYRRQTFGFLFGLLLGAIISLWPFTELAPPKLGDLVRGELISTTDMLLEVDPRDYKEVNIFPSLQELGSAAIFSLLGFSLSLAVGRFEK